MVRCSLAVLFICLFIPMMTIAGGPSNLYVDFDGDGINDNIEDLDNNKIPDQFQGKVHLVLPATSTSLPAFFTQASNNADNEITIPDADKFLLKKYVCRLLTSCRDNFDTDFDTGNNSGSSGGSSCAGGICF